uniref:Uncharacterized protein n=1 Tax=Tetraodon nigroviridis TaxID=99883 RepID=H3C3T8_TETNG
RWLPPPSHLLFLLWQRSHPQRQVHESETSADGRQRGSVVKVSELLYWPLVAPNWINPSVEKQRRQKKMIWAKAQEPSRHARPAARPRLRLRIRPSQRGGLRAPAGGPPGLVKAPSTKSEIPR